MKTTCDRQKPIVDFESTAKNMSIKEKIIKKYTQLGLPKQQNFTNLRQYFVLNIVNYLEKCPVRIWKRYIGYRVRSFWSRSLRSGTLRSRSFGSEAKFGQFGRGHYGPGHFGRGHFCLYFMH